MKTSILRISLIAGLSLVTAAVYSQSAGGGGTSGSGTSGTGTSTGTPGSGTSTGQDVNRPADPGSPSKTPGSTGVAQPDHKKDNDPNSKGHDRDKQRTDQGASTGKSSGSK